ncbi:hypothetical protein NY2A_b011R [Paramecium bursaria Chlorella virus NY2A]|uniref:Uncharacterized protein b011R n=1 Tax=Paramecium bursaria Chlorella virus NY2A TaxID=46021 RepID=A7IVN6_PBCVN|nr:hypothetical protein NY2A_b011R [Paramecium bursaria Chlorella virus NY2A]ABT14410.1 hypothetical protein NY2A_b011R [Paramecium bursaria Chlorella virus NY2A]
MVRQSYGNNQQKGEKELFVMVVWFSISTDKINFHNGTPWFRVSTTNHRVQRYAERSRTSLEQVENVSYSDGEYILLLQRQS